MRLAELMKPWCDLELKDRPILGLENDSRRVKPGYLFLAYPGLQADGRMFLLQVRQAGAAAILYEPNDFPGLENLPKDIPCIPISKLSYQLAKIASRFYEHPSKALYITGVTGTNGKTTIAYQLAQAYDLLEKKSAYIGTIGCGLVKRLQPIQNTTPDALLLQKLLYQYQQQKVSEICLEVSSHALEQGRVDEVAFKQAIFTNLTREHLDYHRTMEAYAKAKAKLFAFPSLQTAILNNDDDYSALMAKAIPSNCQKLSYGLSEAADVKAVNIELTMHHSKLDIISPWGRHHLEVNLLGKFNIYNTLAIFTSLLANDVPASKIEGLISELKPANGRMEIVHKAPYVLVDYAHTPDALENALSTLAGLKKGRLGVVFGCGGDRDKGKRQMMGKIASQYADFVIITSDNPRSEDPEGIVNEIEKGLIHGKEFKKIVDRKAAIQEAISMANKEDMILVAGKGHEDYQIIGQEKHFFSDQDVVRAIFK